MKRSFIVCMFVVILLSGCYIDKIPPSVTIEYPAIGDTVSSVVDINVTASDNIGVAAVNIFVDDHLVVSLSASPFTYAWNTTNLQEYSIHIIHALAYDDADNEAVSDMVTVFVSNSE